VRTQAAATMATKPLTTSKRNIYPVKSHPVATG